MILFFEGWVNVHVQINKGAFLNIWAQENLSQKVLCLLSLKVILKDISFIFTSGFATTHVVVSVINHLLINPTPTNLPNTLSIHTRENKIDR